MSPRLLYFHFILYFLLPGCLHLLLFVLVLYALFALFYLSGLAAPLLLVLWCKVSLLGVKELQEKTSVREINNIGCQALNLSIST